MFAWSLDKANDVIGYCDSYYGGDLHDQKSNSSYVFTLGGTVENGNLRYKIM